VIIPRNEIKNGPIVATARSEIARIPCNSTIEFTAQGKSSENVIRTKKTSAAIGFFWWPENKNLAKRLPEFA
jgi:hypothetical protein